MSEPRIVARKNTHKDGSITLYLYFRNGGYRFRIPVGISILPEDWDPESGRIRGKGTIVQEQNMILTRFVSRANEIITAYYLREVELTPELFRQEIHQTASREDFLSYWEEQMQRNYNRRLFGDAILVQEARTIAKLREFQPVILFSQLSRRLIEQFDEWHAKQLKERGYDGRRARQRALRQMRKYLRQAEDDGKEFTDPFENFTFPKAAEAFTYLELAELKEVIKIYEDRGLLIDRMKKYAKDQSMRDFDQRRFIAEEHVNQIQDHIRVFLFQCFCGARYIDTKRLRIPDHVNKDRTLLIFTPKKTENSSGKTVYFPITPELRSLMSDNPGPIVPCRSNQRYNKVLKVVGALAGLDKNLTTHVGRHTFGSTMVARGVSLVSLADLMGVTSVRTVMKYAHSSLEQQRLELMRAQVGLLKE